MKVGSLFSGIGGIDLGLERAGMQIAWQVEIDPFCRRVLEKHWPNVPKYGDIRELRGDELEPVDLICGGFPCQPFSYAGKRRGKEDDRYLWPEMLRIIKALKPRWVLGENVAGIVNLALDTVLSDLEGEGYETATFIIPACAVGAPHRRDRVWIIAYSASGFFSTEQKSKCEILGRTQDTMGNGKAQFVAEVLADASGARCKKQHTATFANQQGYIAWSSNEDDVADAENKRDVRRNGEFQTDEEVGETRGNNQRRTQADDFWKWWEVEPSVGRVADGVPDRVDRLRALGNAVVPQIPEIIGRAIMEVEKLFGGRAK